MKVYLIWEVGGWNTDEDVPYVAKVVDSEEKAKKLCKKFNNKKVKATCGCHYREWNYEEMEVE